MLEKITNPDRVRIVEGAIPVRHRYTAGVAGDRFLRALRDKGQILATPCPTCGVVYVPGRMFCERDFTALEDWVAVGPGGTLSSYTAVHVDLDGNPVGEPTWMALVLLDGATTVLPHRLEPNGTEPRIGARVQAVIEPKSKRTGSINDIRGFRLS
jgi:uncharacterized OB-fold protein